MTNDRDMNAGGQSGLNPAAECLDNVWFSWGNIWRQPLPHLAHERVTRWALRLVMTVCRSYVVLVQDAERIGPDKDPFILALNHNQKCEALVVPATLIFIRGGKMVHFLSDWNFRLIPGLAFLLRRAQTIPLGNKPARPRFLNRLKPFIAPAQSGFARAQECLRQGRSVGIFPEGTVNRDPGKLLRGRSGASKLSLTTGCPVIPAGIHFPGWPPGQRIGELIPLSLRIGEPLYPEEVIAAPTTDQVWAWHARIMGEIARLSNKQCEPTTKRTIQCH